MKTWVIAAVILLSLVVIAALYSANTLDWKPKEIETGLSYSAKKEPLLVAKLFLQSRDKDLTKFTKQSEFLDNKRLILSVDSSFIVDETAFSEFELLPTALLDWVSRGGHLIYLTSQRRASLAIKNNQILKKTKVRIAQSDETRERYSITSDIKANAQLIDNKDTLNLNLPGSLNFENCTAKAIEVGDAKESLVCEIAYKEGYVTFISNLSPISNSGMRHLDHGSYLLWLIGDNTQMYYLPNLNNPNWLVATWYWSWQFVVLSLLCLAVAMWAVAMRLGLPKTPLELDKTSFTEHIKASGAFMIRHQHHQVLKDALIIDLHNAVERRQPKFKLLSVLQQAEVISRLTQIETDLIVKLLSEPLPENEFQRLHHVKLFKELREKL